MIKLYGQIEAKTRDGQEKILKEKVKFTSAGPADPLAPSEKDALNHWLACRNILRMQQHYLGVTVNPPSTT